MIIVLKVERCPGKRIYVLHDVNMLRLYISASSKCKKKRRYEYLNNMNEITCITTTHIMVSPNVLLSCGSPYLYLS